MSSPLSTLGHQRALEPTVSFGVVRGVVLPASPDDVRPGSGQDPFGVREPLVGAPAEGHGSVATTTARRGGHPGEAPVGLGRCRAAAVALGPQPRPEALLREPPSSSGRGEESLTDRRSGALSPIASRHVLGRRPSLHSSWRSSRKRSRRWTGGHQGCDASLTASDLGMVDQ